MERFKYPSVSEVYSPYMRRSFVGMDIEEIVKSKELCNKVIVHCKTYAKNLWEMELEDECKAYVDSFKLWMLENVDNVESIVCDQILNDDVKRFTGRVDMILKLKSNECISLTFKIGRESKSWQLQLAAYRHLCVVNSIDITRSLILKLSKEGKMATIVEQDDYTSSLQIFDSALITWKYFKGDSDVSA